MLDLKKKYILQIQKQRPKMDDTEIDYSDLKTRSDRGVAGRPWALRRVSLRMASRVSPDRSSLDAWLE